MTTHKQNEPTIINTNELPAIILEEEYLIGNMATKKKSICIKAASINECYGALCSVKDIQLIPNDPDIKEKIKPFNIG